MPSGASALALAGTLLLVSACSSGGGATATDPPLRVSARSSAPDTAVPESPKGPYVALGDSYTSGLQIPTQTGTPTACGRSTRNYPSLVARALGLRAADFTDVSCSGATTADLSAPQRTSDGANPAQLAALTSGTRLVTVGIGGNDVGFTALLARCVEEGLLAGLGAGNRPGTAADAPCRAYYTGSGGDAVVRGVRAAGERLAAALREVRQRSPRARVFVVGYPAVVPAGGTTCSADLGLAQGDVTFLHQEEQQLNLMLRQQAVAAGAVYVDTYTPSVGHDACADEGVRWIEPLTPTSPAAPVHPNERGERGMADAVLRAVRSAR